MTMRTTTRTSSAKSWLGTMSLTHRTGMTSRKQVSPTLGGVRGVPCCPLPALTSPPVPPAKELVTRLMEVEQDQRITAEEAISHEW